MSFFPSFFLHATFRVRGTRSKNEMLEFFFSLLVQIEQRKASKAPKNRFSQKVKRTHFSGVRRVCPSTVLQKSHVFLLPI
jgi:hypothetical protein